jgi:hypothetical protein
MFGPKGNCGLCKKDIPAEDLAMKVADKAYHINCFVCDDCKKRLVPGDKCICKDGKILCCKCSNERMVFAQVYSTTCPPDLAAQYKKTLREQAKKL